MHKSERKDKTKKGHKARFVEVKYAYTKKTIKTFPSHLKKSTAF